MEETRVAQRNGHTPGIFDIGELVPTRRAVLVNGRELLGWVRGRGCRRSVDAEYRGALARYNRAAAELAAASLNHNDFIAVRGLIPTLREIGDLALEDGQAAFGRFIEVLPALQQAASAPPPEDPLAWAEFLNTALVTVLPGLQMEEAEQISDEQAFAVLRHLEWFAPLAQAEGQAEEDGDAADPPGPTTSAAS